MPRRIRRFPALAALAAALLAGVAPSAMAVEFPGQSQIRVQTNGPAAPVEFGDWYSSPLRSGGAGDHFVEIEVPRGWPASRPIDVDLFSPEMNRSGTPIAVALDEVRGTGAGPTNFEIYGPDVPALSPRSPQPGGRGSLVRRDFSSTTAPEQWVRLGTIARPRPGSTYLVRADTSGDDQNGWSLRVGADDDANPNNRPPANDDNPDGEDGTGDELAVRPIFVAYQHFGADGACHTFLRFVDAHSVRVGFNNFDMDLGNTGVVPPSVENQVRLRYYAPSDRYDAGGRMPGSTPSNHAAAILSGNGVWNGGSLNQKVGDVFTNPEGGWWRIVYCANAGNQYIVEADGLANGATPLSLLATKSDGLQYTTRGAVLPYRVEVTNASSGPSASAAANVTLVDPLPPEVSFVSCRILDPFRGSCRLSADSTVVATIRGILRAGRAAQIEIKARVGSAVPDGTVIRNTGTISYVGLFFRRHPEITASDTTIVGGDDPNPAVDPPPGPGGPAF